MSELSRRQLFGALASAALAATSIDRTAAHEAHRALAEQVAATGGRYVPKALNAHEFASLERLTDLIIPAEGSAPGARAAGAAAWIDALAAENTQLSTIYKDGLRWLDRTVAGQAADFVSAPESQQQALLDVLAFKKNQPPDVAAGARFFEWARRMTVDAFYTSKIGIERLGYAGNAVVREFTVPEDVIAFMNKRSPI